ncbi:hypothetical protein M501DRAFT_862710 [Patellaria atrata CBS 101060]|uniref:BOD1/SHG1 domain-containing protein n=1 Tax=Patellaria atrata CBS 101060 TaxID=1346257 RepID=A0A9P4SAT9_9PEZI|nr:hypothetical protein M501DRAFT_862710 [Patellaria atrata CBS 101060]
MAMKHALEMDLIPARKRPKLSELPLSRDQHHIVDSLLHTFKKKGEFDILRKSIYAKFTAGDSKTRLVSALEELTEHEIDRNPSLLSKDRRIAASLIEGAAERSEIYRVVQDDINRYIEEIVVQAEEKMRAVRRNEVGDEEALKEQRLGAKTDEEYAQDAKTRLAKREQDYFVQLRKAEAEAREAQRKLDEERRRFIEAQEAKEKEKREREEKRRAEERARAEEREREKEERERRRRHEERQRMEDYDRDRGYRPREYRRESIDFDKKKIITQVDEINLEDAALQLLLREGQEHAKSHSRPQLERSESMEPPMRKALPPKSIVPRDPATTRLAKLDKLERLSAKSSPREPRETKVGSETPAPAEPDKMDVDASHGVSESKERERSKSRSPHPSESHRRMSIDDTRSVRDEHDRHSRYNESRYKTGRDRNYDRDDYKDRYRDRDGDYRRSSYRDDRDSRRYRDNSKESRARQERSRSPRRSYRERSRSQTRRRRSRSRSPKDIDRYVPNSGRAKGEVGERDRERERDGERETQGHRDRERDRDRARDRNRERDRDRDYRRESFNRDRDGRRLESDRPQFVEIDRYVPGSSSRRHELISKEDREKERGGRERDRDRDRDRDRYEDRERERKRERSRSRSRPRKGYD